MFKYKNNNIQNNIVTIYECFYYNQKSEVFTGQNRNYCNICKQTFDSIYTSKIFIEPNILVLILNRGKGNKSSINKKWYRFNDAIINPITNVQKEVIDFGTSYILFYQRQ